MPFSALVARISRSETGAALPSRAPPPDFASLNPGNGGASMALLSWPVPRGIVGRAIPTTGRQ
jgi:hypothetical protein